MGDKHKSGGSRRHDGTKHTKDVHIGHSGSKEKKKKSPPNIRWNCSQCGNGNNSLALDLRCPFCQSVRGPYDKTYDPDDPQR